MKATENEKSITKVLKYHDSELKTIEKENKSIEDSLCSRISDTEKALMGLGYSLPDKKNNPILTGNIISNIHTWDEIVEVAEQNIKEDLSIYDLFTEEELKSNEKYLCKLREDFNSIHRLDKIDYTICGIAGILSGIIDICLVGIPAPTPDGVKAGTLSNLIRDHFNKKYPPEVMKKLEKDFVVPFDAANNANTSVNVEGLSSYYHRLLSLGHDPILAFIVGVFDIMNGTMTTIDKAGKIVTQIAPNQNAVQQGIRMFQAIAKVLGHLKTDVTTPMGLPVPLMALFNLFQFGSIGEFDQTVAEIVQTMYYEGYDFIHFCSMSIPVMITEVAVRLAYCFKQKNEGKSLKECLPLTTNREKRPKLKTMLFISHSIATTCNAGKVYFTKNPMAINYPQWISFARYSISQVKWVLIDKPEIRHKYVQDTIDKDWLALYENINQLWADYTIENNFCNN